jgi:predicted tellurium resistance membrane protein TerC
MGFRLQEIERLHVGLLVMAACAAYFSGRLAPASLLLGGAVMGGNVFVLRQLAARLFAPEVRRPGIVLGLMLAKFSLLVGLLALLFWRVRLDPLAFGVGSSLLLVACVVMALRHWHASERS